MTNLLFESRLCTKNIQHFYRTNDNLASINRSLYHLYASINCRSISGYSGFCLFTYDTHHRMSSSNCNFVNTIQRLISLICSLFSPFLGKTRFPPQFIGTLLGVMWTTAGIVSFVTYGLTRLATNPEHAWRVSSLFLVNAGFDTIFYRHGQ